jgi:hypothetical protein
MEYTNNQIQIQNKNNYDNNKDTYEKIILNDKFHIKEKEKEQEKSTIDEISSFNEINQIKINDKNQNQNHNQEEIDIIKEYKTSLNSLIDLSLLNKYVESFSNKSNETLPKKLLVFKEKCSNILSKKLVDFKNKINSKLLKLKDNIENEFQALENNLTKAEEGLEEKMKMNKIDNYNNITIEEIKNFFDKIEKKDNTNSNKGIKQELELENIIYFIKTNSDEEKLKNNLKNIETILYSDIISHMEPIDLDDQYKEQLIKGFEINSSLLNKDLEISLPYSSMQKPRLNYFISNPKDVNFKKDITDNLQKNYTIDSLFCAFTTYNGISYVAWANSNLKSSSNSVEIYDLMQDKIIKSIDGFNSFYIYIVRHFFDKYLKKDYMLTTSSSKTCKIFDCEDFSNILTLKECQISTYLYSALIIFDNLSPESPFVITSAPNENLNVWDFDKKLVKTMDTKNDYTYYLNVFYDVRNNENEGDNKNENEDKNKNKNNINNIYIINANGKNVKIYNFRTGNLLKTFSSYQSGSEMLLHMSACVKYIDAIPCLFGSDGNGNFNIWDIDSGNSILNIRIKKSCLRGVCIWNDEYVLVAGSDKCLNVIDLINKKVIGKIKGHSNVICTVQKIIHPIYGESVLTGSIDGKIKIFAIGK